MDKVLINIGCGHIFHRDWINVDIKSRSKYVKKHDIKNGLPFSGKFADAIYTSHMVEHLNEKQVEIFLQESFRVLKPQGIIRIAVPDLEQIANAYLENLKNARENPNELNISNYNWIMLEMYDQTIRGFPGGKMGEYLQQKDIVNKEYIKKRIGYEFNDIINNNSGYLKKLKDIYIKYQIPLLSESYFRQYSGEVHRWMYDSFSLTCLLKHHSFINIKKCIFNQSDIINFSNYNLESENGIERKPDSLYMEARKPSE